MDNLRKLATQLAVLDTYTDIPDDILDSVLQGTFDTDSLIKSVLTNKRKTLKDKAEQKPQQEIKQDRKPIKKKNQIQKSHDDKTKPTFDLNRVAPNPNWPVCNPGDEVICQRPDEYYPRRGVVKSVGNDGITLEDNCPKCPHVVRYPHIQNHFPAMRRTEVAGFADALAQEGYDIDPVQRFGVPGFSQGTTRPGVDHQQLLDTVASSGAPVDVIRALRDGTSDDVEEILRTYISSSKDEGSTRGKTFVQKNRKVSS